MFQATGKFWLGVIAAQMFMGASAASADAFIRDTGRSSQPIGHYEFCQREPAECRATPGSERPVELTRELWSRVVEINNRVNSQIIPLTDYEIWGVEEYWSYPVNGYGDCEDYALEKRRLLHAAGVPLGNLMIAVVRQSNGDGHAVLTIRTHLGDFVLDNLEPRVLAWNETEYEFLKRQSPAHAGVWNGINDSRQLLVGSVRR